ncbi:hypothetical protein MPLB_1990036 [Mesorhizobium sp. ORS 3324]|nr:hypothetical protein MPLB_1990036 [Mesorhizobium sp. ORS 3324]
MRLIMIAARVVETKTQIPACTASILLGPAHPAHRPHPATRDINEGNPETNAPQSPACHHRRINPGARRGVKTYRNGDQSATSGRRKLIAVHQAGQVTAGDRGPLDRQCTMPQVYNSASLQRPSYVRTCACQRLGGLL